MLVPEEVAHAHTSATRGQLTFFFVSQPGGATYSGSKAMTMLCEFVSPSRRAVLGASGALFAWAFMPRFAAAAQGRDARFVTIILRGALDGLTAVPPIGDPDYEGLRQGISSQNS